MCAAWSMKMVTVGMEQSLGHEHGDAMVLL